MMVIWSWLRSLDYGSVPAWFGAGSLMLAFVVFFRDRSSAARNQVDQVGFWMEPQWERRFPLQDGRVEEGTIERFIRNSSTQPIDVAQIAFDVTTRWWVRDLKQWSDDFPIWSLESGTGPIRFFATAVRVPPDDLWRSGQHKINFSHLAPPDADQLDPIEGVQYQIRWVLVADSHGRRWEVRLGRRNRRLYWFSHRRRDYPPDWQHRSTRAFRRFPHWMREHWVKLRERRAAELMTKGGHSEGVADANGRNTTNG
jgi:hypothetical protein